MKKTLILILTLFALNTIAYSQTKIGVIDAQQIIGKSKKGQQLQKRLENLQKSKQNQITTRQNEIKTLEKEIQSPALNQATRQTKSRELQTKRTTLKRFVEDAQREMQRESQKELTAIEKELMPIIRNYGKANGFSIIYDLSRAGIVYFDNAIDITANIIRAYDARTAE